MKLLQVNKFYAPTHGGVEKVVQDIAESLAERGHQADVLACVERGKARTDSINGIHVEKAASWGKMLSMPLSTDILDRFRVVVKDYDLVLLHHPFPLGFLAYLFFGGTKPMAVWYHANITRQRIFGFLLRPVLWFILREAQAIFVSGKGIVDNSSLLRPFREKCVVIPFGIDAAWAVTTPDIMEQARKIRGEDKRPLIFALGRAVSYKGFEYLIDAMPDVDARLIHLGGGPLLGALKARAKKRGVADKVSFVGAAADSRPYFAACDIFVLPSVTAAEAFGVVQIEAMAYGKPVVNTSLPSAVAEVSLQGVTGVTVPPRNAEALAEALQRLVSNLELRTQYGKAARERFEKEFTRDIFAERIEKTLDNILTKPNIGV